MNAFNIRPANHADIPLMRAIEMESPTAAHWPANEYDRIFDPGGVPRFAFVTEANERIAGFIVVRRVGNEWELENVAVAQACRRHGFGRALIQSALDLAKQEKARSMFLEVRESNQPARSLYSQLGFRETGRRPAYYSHPVEDAITYEIVIEL